MGSIDRVTTKAGTKWRARWRDPDEAQRSKTVGMRRDAEDFLINAGHYPGEANGTLASITEVMGQGAPLVYRLYGEQDLLYIGWRTEPVQLRLAGHRSKPWWPEVSSVSVHRFPERSDAQAEEVRAISRERPRYNVNGRGPLG